MWDPGDEHWWRQVRRLGVSRDDVECWLDIAAGEGAREDIDPHHLQPGSAAAEQVVTHVLLAHYVPTYASLMYIAHRWDDASRSLKEWIVTAYAQFIEYGDERHREAALYSLWCQYFEVPARAAFVFPRLIRQLYRVGVLLEASGPVPWEVKRAIYLEASRDPELHASLAIGLASSFYDAFGSVEPVEARALAEAIEIEDDSVKKELASIFETPTRWRITGVVDVNQLDPRWRAWLPDDAGPSFLIRLSALDRPIWVRGSELWHGSRLLGALLHFGFPFDPAIRHRRWDVPFVGSTPLLFRIEGELPAVRDALGAEVDAWPSGLGPRSRIASAEPAVE